MGKLDIGGNVGGDAAAGDIDKTGNFSSSGGNGGGGDLSKYAVIVIGIVVVFAGLYFTGRLDRVIDRALPVPATPQQEIKEK